MLKLLPTQWRRDEKLTFERSKDVVTDWPNYPFAAAPLSRRRSQGHRRWRAWHRRHYQDDAANEAAKPLSRFATQRRLHADGLRRPCARVFLQQGSRDGASDYAACTSTRCWGMWG